MFSTCVFDLDGTLLNTLDDLANAGNYTLTTLSFPVHPVESYKRMVGNGIRNLISRCLPPDQRDSATLHLALGIFTEYYNQHSLDATAPYPGILEMLSALSESGIQLAVLSNKNDSMTKQIVKHYFGNTFAAVWGLRADYSPKPEPASLLDLLAELGCDKTAALYCGDSDVDMLTAKNAQVASCGVLWGYREEAELRAAGSQYLAVSPQNLADLVLRPSSEE